MAKIIKQISVFKGDQWETVDIGTYADKVRWDSNTSQTVKDKIQGLQNQANGIGSKAPIDHASSTGDYGKGNLSKYGHVKLINSLLSSIYSDGQALSARQGYVLDGKISSLATSVQRCARLGGKASGYNTITIDGFIQNGLSLANSPSDSDPENGHDLWGQVKVNAVRQNAVENSLHSTMGATAWFDCDTGWIGINKRPNSGAATVNYEVNLAGIVRTGSGVDKCGSDPYLSGAYLNSTISNSYGQYLTLMTTGTSAVTNANKNVNSSIANNNPIRRLQIGDNVFKYSSYDVAGHTSGSNTAHDVPIWSFNPNKYSQDDVTTYTWNGMTLRAQRSGGVVTVSLTGTCTNTINSSQYNSATLSEKYRPDQTLYINQIITNTVDPYIVRFVINSNGSLTMEYIRKFSSDETVSIPGGTIIRTFFTYCVS